MSTIAFKQEDWDEFCNGLVQGADPRQQIKRLTSRAVDGPTVECGHPSTRQISTISRGNLVICTVCEREIA